MATPLVTVLPGQIVPVPIPPPGDGASGGGYDDPEYVSIAVDCWGGPPVPVRVYPWPFGTSGAQPEYDVHDDLLLDTGRHGVALPHKGCQFISVWNKDPWVETSPHVLDPKRSRIIVVMTEWSRPPVG